MSEAQFFAAIDRARDDLYLDDDLDAFRATMTRLGFDAGEIEEQIAEIVEDADA